MAAMAATTAAAAAWEASSAAHRTSYILNRRPPPPLVTALLAESWQSQRQSQSERVAESVVAGTSRVLQTPSFSSSSSTSLPQHRQTETTTQPQTDRHRKVASASASASSGFLCLETPLTSSQVLSLQATLNFLCSRIFVVQHVVFASLPLTFIVNLLPVPPVFTTVIHFFTLPNSACVCKFSTRNFNCFLFQSICESKFWFFCEKLQNAFFSL